VDPLLVEEPVLKAPEAGREDGGEKTLLLPEERGAVDQGVDGEVEVLREERGKEGGREGGREERTDWWVDGEGLEKAREQNG